jgi:hypothetical protein
MNTTRYTTHVLFLVVDRDGEARVRHRKPDGTRPTEYVFKIIVRVPFLARPAIAGEATLELPPDVHPDADPELDVAGPEGGSEDYR